MRIMKESGTKAEGYGKARRGEGGREVVQAVKTSSDVSLSLSVKTSSDV